MIKKVTMTDQRGKAIVSSNIMLLKDDMRRCGIT